MYQSGLLTASTRIQLLKRKGVFLRDMVEFIETLVELRNQNRDRISRNNASDTVQVAWCEIGLDVSLNTLFL